MPHDNQFEFDVFISYSSKDQDWVEQTLLPRVEQAGVKVCIDFRDFKLGRASLLNMQDAVRNSRHTVLVLTENWFGSQWTLFESVLTATNDPAGLQQRTIPLRLRKSEMPQDADFIANLTYVDFSRADREDLAWRQLLTALGKPPKIEPPPSAAHGHSRTVATEAHGSASVGVKVIKRDEHNEQNKDDAPKSPHGSADGGAGRDRPLFGPNDFIKWTDYTEDYFYNAIWRWEYRPQMGNQEPRNISGWCPECDRPLEPLQGVGIGEGGVHCSVFVCRAHPLRQYFIPAGNGLDYYDGIRKLIREKLANDQWREVVKHQMDVRRGLI